MTLRTVPKAAGERSSDPATARRARCDATSPGLSPPNPHQTSGDGGGDAERCVVGSGRVAPEAGSESSEPPHETSATEVKSRLGQRGSRRAGL